MVGRVDDPISHVIELDETNNLHTETLTSPNLVYADLTVTDLWIWPADGDLEHGVPLIVYATVKNDSSVEIPTTIPVALLADNLQVAVVEVEGLAAGASKKLNVIWDTTDAEEVSYRVLGYVKFYSQITEPRTLILSRPRIFLPLVMRN